MANLIEQALIVKRKIKLVRFHQSGDFFSQAYFDAWLMVAINHPEWIVYGYTKALPYWVKRLHSIPPNFKLVASRGGTHDYLIEMFGLRSVRVVLSEREAKRKCKLPIDHDDTHVWKHNGDFAIVIHGTQPAGSKAGKAWYKIARHGKGGYNADYFKHKDKAKQLEYERKARLARKMQQSLASAAIKISPKQVRSDPPPQRGLKVNPQKIS